MRNPFKAQIKAALLARHFAAETVRKGMSRGERWMKAAYGDADYTTLLAEAGGLDGAVQTMAIYCREVDEGNERTFNRETFGIYGTGRRS